MASMPQDFEKSYWIFSYYGSFYLLTIGYMASMPQDFEKKFLDIFVLWFLLKYYHFILISMTPIDS